ncbi:hypothetical protein OK016_16785 [Vibrio chagasii]|nr:hypothetical protein [Vibrio chagasii]
MSRQTPRLRDGKLHPIWRWMYEWAIVVDYRVENSPVLVGQNIEVHWDWLCQQQAQPSVEDWP